VLRNFHFLFSFSLCVSGVAGCGCDEEARRSRPPEAAEGGDPCTFSADCPSGTHCDLGQCLQVCNVDLPCAEDGLECTVRGRCVASGEEEVDPAPVPLDVDLEVSPAAVALAPGEDAFDVHVAAAGVTRYRLEPSADWILVDTARSELNDSLDVRVSVDLDAAPTDGTQGFLYVFTDAGRSQVQVTAPVRLTGVYRGTLHATTVTIGPDADPTEVAIDLGHTELGLEVLELGGDVQARIESGSSLLWPGAEGDTASGTGTFTRGLEVALHLAQVTDLDTLAPLFAQSPPLLASARVGRQLDVGMELAGSGTLTGTYTETIHGLTSEPIVVEGVVELHLVPDASEPDFVAPGPPTMPDGPARDPGAMPAGCACAGVTDDELWACVTSELTTGAPLDQFYLDDPSASTFEVGLISYDAVASECRANLGVDLRADAGPGGTCVVPTDVQCARWLASDQWAEADSLRLQGAHDASRAWAEIYLLLGNEAMVQAALEQLQADPAAAMKQRLTEARAAYDAGLARLLDPRLFEELLALGPTDALDGPFAPARPNDRAALRKLADLLAGSLSATAQVVEIDGVGRGVEALRAAAGQDAVLAWLQLAMVARLEAQWRGDQAPTPEASALGPSLTALNRRIAALRPGFTPLGIPRSYVPLLARTGDGTETNFERLLAIATTSVETAVGRQDDAVVSVRDFDDQVDRIEQALLDADDEFLSEVTALCGNDFVDGDGNPNADPLLCGATTGEMRDLLLGAETARLDMAAATDQIEVLGRRVEIKTNTAARVLSLREEDLSFQESTGNVIYALDYAKAAVDGIKSGVEAGSECGIATPGKCAAAAAIGALEFASGAISAEREKLVRMQEMHSARTDMTIEYEQAMAEIKEMLLDQQGLRIQEAIAQNEFARALNAIASARERLANLSADHDGNRANAARPHLNDPAFRIQRDRAALRALSSFRRAKLDVYLAARGLEYETNVELPQIAESILGAWNATALEDLLACVQNAWNDWLRNVSSTNTYETDISIREDLLGIVGPREDLDTHETIPEGEQFRRYLFEQAFVRGGAVWPAIRFGTTLNPGDAAVPGLFSNLLCNDRIQSVQIQILGDAALLGDAEAEVQILADGGNLLRACDADGEDRIVEWGLRPDGDPAPALVQSGINGPSAAAPNRSLEGFAVAQTSWIVTVPDASASPANVDLDPLGIEDIVLHVTHVAIAAGAGGTFAPTCD